MENIIFLTKKDISSLPMTAGVYLFFARRLVRQSFLVRRSLGEGGSGGGSLGEGRLWAPIYIGKAINIKERVKNHFFQPTHKDDLYIKNVEKIGFIETKSEIEALILEASLIKKHQPKFNSVWRDDKNYFYVAITQGERPIAFVTHQKKDTKTQYIGPFTEGNALKKTLKFLRKIFPFYTHSTGSGRASAKHPEKKCTWCHLELCPGPLPNLVEYKKNIKKLTLILQGKRKTVLYALKKEMADVSRQNKFEEAMQIRDKISALEQVMSHANVIENKKQQHDNWETTQKILQEILQVKNPISKIECYDISNIQGTLAAASMVVFVNGKPDKSQYKKFSIRFADASDPNLLMTSESTNKKLRRPYELLEKKPNDIAMLKQILTRRFLHPEWEYPQVILIDGGIAQLNIGIKTRNEMLKNINPVKSAKGGVSQNAEQFNRVKIISIAKGKRELLIEGPSFAKASTTASAFAEASADKKALADKSAGKAKKIPLKNLPQEIYNLIVHLDDEAHRFAIIYHKKLRKKALLD